jgi:hypothetical protein
VCSFAAGLDDLFAGLPVHRFPFEQKRPFCFASGRFSLPYGAASIASEAGLMSAAQDKIYFVACSFFAISR